MNERANRLERSITNFQECGVEAKCVHGVRDKEFYYCV